MVISAQSVSNGAGATGQGRILPAVRSDSATYAAALLAAASQVDVSAQALSILAGSDVGSSVVPAVNPAPDSQAPPAVGPGTAASSPAASNPTAVNPTAAATAAVVGATAVSPPATAAAYLDAAGALQGLLAEAAAQALSTVATDPAYAAAAAGFYASTGAMQSPTNDSQYPLPRVRSPLIPPVMPSKGSTVLSAT